MPEEQPYLSIVIPAYNEAQRLPASLQKIAAYLSTQPYASEIIIVNNGSSDNTSAVVTEAQKQIPNLFLLEEHQRGKGLAVKRGMFLAKGSYRFQADADLSMPIEEVSKFIPPKLESCQVAIASRELAGAKRFGEPAYRHLVGRVFNALVRILALPGLQDTQCGFKCFRGDVAESIFSQQTLKGMSFDAEVLVIARRHGYPIHEVPINWYFNPDSRVRLFKDSLAMTFDLFRIRRNLRQGLYDPPQV